MIQSLNCVDKGKEEEQGILNTMVEESQLLKEKKDPAQEVLTRRQPDEQRQRQA